jgi:hypothetical protein
MRAICVISVRSEMSGIAAYHYLKFPGTTIKTRVHSGRWHPNKIWFSCSAAQLARDSIAELFMSGNITHCGLLPALFAFTACTTAAPLPQPPTMRASLGTIGIVSAPATESFVFSHEKTFFGGAAQGLREWSATTSYVDSHSRSYSPYAGVALLLLLPVAPIVGGVNAWIGGLSSSDKRKVEKVFRELLPPDQLQNKLRKDVVDVAHNYWAGDLLDGAADAELYAGKNYSVRNVQNVDTVLEVSFLPAAITSSDQDDPVVQAAFSARARLIRAADRKVLWTYETNPSLQKVIYMSLSQLSSNPREQLEPQINDAIETLAREIIVQIVGETTAKEDKTAVPAQVGPDDQDIRK